METLRVIDADGHVMEDRVDWRERIDPAYRDRAPHLFRDFRNRPRILVEGRVWPIVEGPGVGNPGIFSDDLPIANRYRRGMSDPAARLVDMDLEGIDVAVLFGTMIGLSAANIADPGLADAVCRAYNDWLAEFCSHDQARLKAVALVPLQDVKLAVRELERAVLKLGMPTAMLPTNIHGKNLDHPDLYPFYDAAQALEVPLCCHAGIGHNGMPGVYGTQNAGTERFDVFYFTHAVGFPFEQMIAMISLVGGGIMDLYPGLKFAFLEAGAGWLPYWVERMDEHYHLLHPQVPKLRRRPSEHLKSGRIYVSCDSDEATLPHVLELVGEDAVIYASDYCHWDCRFPDSVRLIAERDRLSERAKARVLGENAMRFFGFKESELGRRQAPVGASRSASHGT
jgi:predicted TIM-barrel fold metal-dependent hydrolase